MSISIVEFVIADNCDYRVLSFARLKIILCLSAAKPTLVLQSSTGKSN